MSSPTSPEELEQSWVTKGGVAKLTMMTLPQLPIDDVITLKKAIDRHYTPKSEARKTVASEIFSLAHKYAWEDKTMLGAEKLRAYHYLNAIAKIGEFDGR